MKGTGFRLLLGVAILVVWATATAASPSFPLRDFAPAPSARQDGPWVLACSILLVDDDWDFGSPSGGGRPYYTSALDALGLSYNVWDTDYPYGTAPGYQDMAPYDVVVWFTGYAWENVFTPQNESATTLYLNSGGRFVLSSLDYSDEPNWPTPFMSNYLGIEAFVENVKIRNTAGTAGDPIGGELGSYPLVRPDDWDTYWPTGIYEGPADDEVYSLPFALQPFRYNDVENSNPNATAYDAGAFRTVYLAWPLEWIDTVAQRAQILDAILLWLGCGGSIELEPAAQFGDGPPGGDVTYALTLYNNLDEAEKFELSYEAAWPVTGPAEVGPIPAGSHETFGVTASIPVGALCYESDLALVTARALSQPPIADTAALETSSQPDGPGDLEGTVYDANTGLGLGGADVRLALADELYETESGPDGAYRLLDLPACTYLGEFSATNYGSQSGISIAISAGLTTTLDVHLGAPIPVLSDNVVSVAVPTGGTEMYTLLLGNAGTARLTFGITELPLIGAEDRPALGAASPPHNEWATPVRLAVAGDAGASEDIPWLMVMPARGAVATGGEKPIELTFEAGAEPPGTCLAGALSFRFDDPYTGTVSLPVEMCVVCVELAGITIAGPAELPAGVTGWYSATWQPGNATPPIDLEWSNGATGEVAAYTWGEPGAYDVAVAGTNCTSATVTATLEVTVTVPRLYLPVVQRGA